LANLRRRTLFPAALTVLALTGCATSATTAITATSQPVAITLTPSPSIPDAQTSVHRYKFPAGLGTLVVDNTIGNVTVTGGHSSGVEVIAYATYSSTPPAITRTVSGGTLTIGYTCPVQVPCRVTFGIWVPSGIAVRVATHTGSIWLNDLAGAVTASAGAGYLYGSGLTAQTASFSTDAGGINATFTSPPAAVTASTMLGPVNIQVPVTVAYRMITNAVGGNVTVSVPQATASARTITASTNLGSVDVTSSQPAPSISATPSS
jgi:hypothetical protein